MGQRLGQYVKGLGARYGQLKGDGETNTQLEVQWERENSTESVEHSSLCKVTKEWWDYEVSATLHAAHVVIEAVL